MHKLRITNAFFPAIIIIISLASLVFIWFLGKDTQKNVEEVVIKQYGGLETEIAGQVALTAEKMISGLKTELEIAARIPAVRDIDPKNCTLTLEKIYEGLEPKIFNLGRVNKEGVMVCSVTKETIGRDVSGSAHIAEVLRTKKVAFGRLLKNQTTGEYLLAIHVPVFGANNEFTGTLGGAISLSKFKEDYLKNINFAQKGYVVLQDDNGDMLYHPDPELLGRNLNDEYMKKVLAESKELQDLTKETQAGLTGTKRYIFKGEWKFAAYKPAHIAEGRYWSVVVTVPEKEIKGFVAPVLAGLQYRALASMAIVILFALGLIISLRQRGQILEKKIQERTRELEEARVNLEVTVRERTQKAQELTEKNQQLTGTIQDLENTEKAMQNLLEDEKALEEQLKLGKTSVERKVEERTRELQEERSKLQASIDSLNVGFIITNKDTEIVSINGAARRILCVGQDTLPGVIKPSSRIVYDCTLEDIEKQLIGEFDLRSQIEKCLKEQKAINVKDVSFRGLFLHIFLTPISTITDGKLNIIGVAVLVEDVTEEKILQRSRDEFFSIASHELRTPLTAIKGNTAMILDYFGSELKDPQMKEMIDDVHQSSIRLIEIVNDFLDVSRLEIGKMQFKKDILDLSELIPNVIKEYQVSSSRKKLYIHFENLPAGRQVPPVLGDKDRFKQVLINLIGNGLKFTKEGGVTISLKTEGKLVKVLVFDTGMGISADNQKLLFRKFQQAESNIYTRDATKGTGLGLYISRMMVKGMGGEIKLEKSVVGKGSVFSFTLPVAKAV